MRHPPPVGFDELGEPWRSVLSDRDSTFVTRFRPDEAIFGRAAFDYYVVRRRLDEVAAAHPGYRVLLVDERRSSWQSAVLTNRVFAEEEAETIVLPDGMLDLMRRDCLAIGLRDAGPLRVVHRDGDLALDVAIQWGCAGMAADTVVSWANSVRTRDGTHVRGLERALRAAGADLPQISARMSVFLPQPRFVTPTKDVLSNDELLPFVRDAVEPALRRAIEEDEHLATVLRGMQDHRRRCPEQYVTHAFFAWLRSHRDDAAALVGKHVAFDDHEGVVCVGDTLEDVYAAAREKGAALDLTFVEITTQMAYRDEEEP